MSQMTTSLTIVYSRAACLLTNACPFSVNHATCFFPILPLVPVAMVVPGMLLGCWLSMPKQDLSCPVLASGPGGCLAECH
jgi:hypothetical protein